MRSLLLLTILSLWACGSTQESIRRQNTNMSTVGNDAAADSQAKSSITNNAPPSREERREEARGLLKQAGELNTDCAKAEIHQQILEQYSDLPEARFSRNFMSALKSKVVRLNKQLRDNFLKLEKVEPTEVNVSDRIQRSEEFLANCPVSPIEELVKADIEFYQKYRLKRYGY